MLPIAFPAKNPRGSWGIAAHNAIQSAQGSISSSHNTYGIDGDLATDAAQVSALSELS